MQAINFVFIYPRNKRYCTYYINDNNEAHSKTYEDLQKFLINLSPDQTVEIREAISRFQTFLLDISNKKIKILKLNYQAEITFLKKKLLHESLSIIEKKKRRKYNAKNIIDKYIKNDNFNRSYKKLLFFSRDKENLRK